MKKIAFGFLALLLLSACSSGNLSGTETGNALAPNGNPANGSSPTTLNGLITDVCNSVKACDPSADAAECQTQLGQQQGIPQLLGVPSTTGITTISQLSNSTAPAVAASPTQVGGCASGIAALSCQSTAAQGAFNSSTGSYALVANEFSRRISDPV